MEKICCPFKDIEDTECEGYINENDDVNIVKLSQQRAIDSINSASKERGTNVNVEIGTVVHKECRKRYIHVKYIASYKKQKTDEDNISMPSLRSSKSQSFDYKTHCFLCGHITVDANGKKSTRCI